MPLPPQTRIQRGNAVAWRLLEGRVIAITSHDTSIHRMNPSGTYLWEFLGESGRTVNEIETGLIDRFGLSPEAAHRDASAFLKKGLHHRLLSGR